MSHAVALRIEGYRPRPHRSLEERMAMRLPMVNRALLRVVLGLSPRSRLRQSALRHAVRGGWSALNRRDVELLVARHYTPDVVGEWAEGFVALGMPERINGRGGYLSVWSEFFEAWAEVLMTPLYLVDLGERLLQLARGVARGAASGADVGWDIALIMDLRGGRVARERFFTEWDEGFRTAGIDPAVLPEIELLGPRGALDLSTSTLAKAS